MTYFNSFTKLYSVYSKSDEEVISLGKKYRMPIIGGTGLEILLNHYKITSVKRPRSKNDIDFLMCKPNDSILGFFIL